MIKTIYILLLLLMTLCMFFSGKIMQKVGNGFWKSSFMAIVAFTLNEGLRFGRGVDYNTYATNQFLEIEQKISDPIITDWLFVAISRMIISLGGGWQVMVLFMSFTLIYAICFFIYHHAKDVAPWALTVFALLYSKSPENLMRWYLALSFVIIGITYYLNDSNLLKNKLLFVLFSILGFLCHYGIILVPVAFLFLFIIKRIFLNPLITIGLYFVFAILFSMEFMKYFLDFVQLFSYLNDTTANVYLDNSDYYVIEGGIASKNGNIGFMPFSLFGVHMIGIFLGYKVIKAKKDSVLNFCFNCYSLGFALYSIGNQNELLNRYVQCFQLFGFIVLAYALYFLFHKNIKLHFNPFVQFLAILLLFNQMRVVFINPFRDPISEHYLYVWDSNGRKYIDNWTYYLNPTLSK